MSITERTTELPESEFESSVVGLNFKETELTLGLPGGGCGGGESLVKKLAGSKRGFNNTVNFDLGKNENDGVTSKPPAKAQVVGWPPIRSYRKNMMKSCKYVKVAVDGAPYLRKVDLETYNSYQELLVALEDMFTCLTICNILNERKLMDPANGTEYVPTYEDKDGDWMLVGDVPWKMFVESCKRMRLRKSSEAIGLAPRTLSKGSTASC